MSKIIKISNKRLEQIRKKLASNFTLGETLNELTDLDWIFEILAENSEAQEDTHKILEQIKENYNSDDYDYDFSDYHDFLEKYEKITSDHKFSPDEVQEIYNHSNLARQKYRYHSIPSVYAESIGDMISDIIYDENLLFYKEKCFYGVIESAIEAKFLDKLDDDLNEIEYEPEH